MFEKTSRSRCTVTQSVGDALIVSECDAAIRALGHRPKGQIETIDVHQIDVKG